MDDMTALWGRFMSDHVVQRIPNKLNNDIICVYTEYEGDHTKPYTAILGCQVSSANKLPDGMVTREFKGGNYVQRIAQGNLHAGVVHIAWQKIWADTSLKRTYDADWEVYGVNAADPTNAIVEIYLGVE